MNKILINVLPLREIRVAVITANEKDAPTTLHDLHIVHSDNRQLEGNIYKARVSAVKKELDAAFVDFGEVKEGLLPASRIGQPTPRSQDSGSSAQQPKIENLVNVGDEILVQVEKEPRGEKGAALTTRVQVLGQHVILSTNRTSRRVSRKIRGSARDELYETLRSLKLPEGMSILLRTSAGHKDKKTLQTDVDECIKVFDLINHAHSISTAPRLLYEESNLVNTVLRDNLHNQIGEIIVDDMDIYNQTVDFVNTYMPDFEGKIVLDEDHLPLFTKFKVEKESKRVYDREISLPSGGQIVLDPTEAFLSVDVNSAKNKYRRNFSEMVLNTNLQAADALFRQLCLRNIGGLIVVDFIDMELQEDIDKIQDRVEKLCSRDRYRTKASPISSFGLMQLQRRRTNSSIYDAAFETCNACSGHGKIRTVSSIAQQIYREIEAKCFDRRTNRIRTHVTPTVAAFLTNELRSHLSVLEISSKTTIEIIPDLEGENATYITHSFRNSHSTKPQRTESFVQGKKEREPGERKHHGGRTAPAESVKEAAVTRADVDHQTSGRKAKKPAHAQSDKRIEEMKSAMLALSPLVTAFTNGCSFIFRRLFVVETDETKTKPSSKQRAKKSTRTERKTTTPSRQRTGKSQERNQNKRRQPQRAKQTETSARGSSKTDTTQDRKQQERVRKGQVSTRSAGKTKHSDIPLDEETTKTRSKQTRAKSETKNKQQEKETRQTAKKPRAPRTQQKARPQRQSRRSASRDRQDSIESTNTESGASRDLEQPQLQTNQESNSVSTEESKATIDESTKLKDLTTKEGNGHDRSAESPEIANPRFDPSEPNEQVESPVATPDQRRADTPSEPNERRTGPKQRREREFDIGSEKNGVAPDSEMGSTRASNDPRNREMSSEDSSNQTSIQVS